jgi:hypothetical protein
MLVFAGWVGVFMIMASFGPVFTRFLCHCHWLISTQLIALICNTRMGMNVGNLRRAELALGLRTAIGTIVRIQPALHGLELCAYYVLTGEKDTLA